MHDQHGTDGELMGSAVNKHLRKNAQQTPAPRPYKRKRQSSYTGRLHAARVPGTRGQWPGKRGRRPSWKDVQLTQIDEACEFSNDRDLSDPVAVVRELKRHPQYLKPGYDATRHLYLTKPDPELPAKNGRRRMQGDWLLLYLAFVMTGDTSRMSFWNRYASSPIWQECGFAVQPDYEIMRIRFNELEQYWMGVRDMGRLVIRQAVRHDPEIADFWMVDSTGWQTPATLEHCCADKVRCKALRKSQSKKKPAKQKTEDPDGDDSPSDKSGEDTPTGDDELVKGSGRRAPERLRRAPAESIEQERHKEQASLEPDPTVDADSAIEPDGEDETYQYFRINGHRYRTRDKTAGLRHYDSGKGRTWLGGYGQPAVAPKYGTALAAETFPADDQEWDHYDDLFESAVAATGKAPLAVSGDRGFALKSFYEYNTRRGVATVVPFRKTPSEEERADMRSDLVDEHGVPRCKHCGGEGDMDSNGLGWYLDNKGNPRIRFRCHSPAIKACEKKQSVACAEEWRLLQPLNLTQPLYHSLREMHFTFERIFGHWRQRYGVYGKDPSSALRRKGVDAQRLRAQAAIFLDWFRISLRHGFLGSWRTRNLKQAKNLIGNGMKRLQRVLDSRRRRMLDLPYGAAAERLHLWRAKQTGAPPGAPPPSAAPDPGDPFPPGF